jgi:hypothetical protein
MDNYLAPFKRIKSATRGATRRKRVRQNAGMDREGYPGTALARLRQFSTDNLPNHQQSPG